MKLIATLFASLVMLASCSEDTISPTKPRLEITLSPQQIFQYVTPALMYARLSGYEYQSNVSVKWYFEGGDTLRSFIIMGGGTYSYYFKTAGTQTVSAVAYDQFNGQRIDSTSITVIVEPTQPKILITPANIDTTLIYYPSYGYLFQHRVTANVYVPNNEYKWRVRGENLDTILSNSGTLTFGYPKPSTYQINVDMIDRSTHATHASDSTTITIR